jgi:hypothetical protein
MLGQHLSGSSYLCKLFEYGRSFGLALWCSLFKRDSALPVHSGLGLH